MSDSQNPLAGYPVVVEIPVLWGHMDAFQHVNNTVYFRFFESARIAYGDRIEMYKFLTELGIGPILAATSCSFLKPLRYPDTVKVGCKTARLTEVEMEQEYLVYSDRLKKPAAAGTAKIVAYDYNQLKKSRFPKPLIDNILRLEPDLRLA